MYSSFHVDGLYCDPNKRGYKGSSMQIIHMLKCYIYIAIGNLFMAGIKKNHNVLGWTHSN